MNLLTKTTPWVVASLLAAATAFGQDKCGPASKGRTKSFEQGQKMAQSQMMPGYNAPARIDVRGSWDVSIDGSFIYWQMSQDNMELAFADTLSNGQYQTSTQIKGNFVPMDFDYLPGFKVGIGINFDLDNWDSHAEYTMLHGSNSTSTNGSTTSSNQPAPLFASWGNAYVQAANVFNTASEHWRSNLDIGDIDLGRVYYVGTSLTFRPAFGARCAWIMQNVHAHYVNTLFSSTTPLEIPGVLDVYARSHSWAVGPRTGLNMSWLVGQGIRFFGNADVDVLYTKYKLQNKSTFIATSTVGTVTPGTLQYHVAREKVSALRTHLDLDLGFGWGSYFDNNNWHIDLSASYGFQVFFDQNMFPHSLNISSPGKQLLATGNLYAQGLTATVRLDF